MQNLAASLAFRTVVSIVPLLAVALSVFHAFGGFERVLNEVERVLLQDLAGASGTEVRHALRAAVAHVRADALGAGGVAGLLFTSTKLFYDIDTAVHRVWGIPRRRSLWLSLAIYWLAMIAGPLALAAAIGLAGSIDIRLLDEFPARSAGLLIGWLGMFGICKWLPSRRVAWRPAWWCSIAATAAFFVAQVAYAYLAQRILNYDKIYGSLAAVPIFLLWILLLWQICLASVGVCALWQKRIDAQKESTAYGP